MKGSLPAPPPRAIEFRGRQRPIGADAEVDVLAAGAAGVISASKSGPSRVQASRARSTVSPEQLRRDAPERASHQGVDNRRRTQDEESNLRATNDEREPGEPSEGREHQIATIDRLMRYCRRRVNNHGKQGEKEECRLRIKSIRSEPSDEGAARKLERRGWRIVFSDREAYGVR